MRLAGGHLREQRVMVESMRQHIAVFLHDEYLELCHRVLPSVYCRAVELCWN